MTAQTIIRPSRVHHARLHGDILPKPRATVFELACIPDEEHEMSELRQIYWGDVNRPLLHTASRTRRPSSRKLAPPCLAEAKAHVDRCQSRDHISDTLRGTYNHFIQSGSLSATARHCGVCVNTVRDRILSYRMKVARSLGLPAMTVQEARQGRVVKTNKGRPTKAEQLARAMEVGAASANQPTGVLPR